MMKTATFPAGLYRGPLPEGFLPHLEEHLTEYGQPVLKDGDWMSVTFGEATVRIRVQEQRLDMRFLAGDAAQLHRMRELSMYLLDHIAPEAAAGIGWSGFEAIIDRPPNFHLARLLSRQKIGANFLRVELACDGIAQLSKGGMHFSLLIPPEGRDPVWPGLDEKGRTKWAEGADQLHRAAFTFVELAEGRFTFDIYLHHGSRSCDWASSAPIGSIVGITGPGGGDFPPGDWILLAGDETALPAIRRILQHSAQDRRCTVILDAAPGDRVLGAMPPGTSVRWIDRGAGEGLVQALREVQVPPPGESRFVWVAMEREAIREARAHFKTTAALAATESYFSWYWARSTTPE